MTKDEIISKIVEELNDVLDTVNANSIKKEDVVEVDLENQTITIKIPFHLVEEDNYVGLGVY